jgi:hypothetical protein
MHGRGFERWRAAVALAAAGLLTGCGTSAGWGNPEGLSGQERQEAARLRQQRDERAHRPKYNGTIRDIPESAQGRLKLPPGASPDTEAYPLQVGPDTRAGAAHGSTPQPVSFAGAGGAPQGRPDISGASYAPRDPGQWGSAVQSPAGGTTPAPHGTTPGHGVGSQAHQDPGAGGAGTEGRMDDYKTPESQHGPEGAQEKPKH